MLALLLVQANGLEAAETLALISDINGRYGSRAYHARVGTAVNTLLELNPGVVLSAGDMVAGQKQPKLDRQWLDDMWRAFDAEVRNPLAQAGIPLLVTPGNHDGSAYPAFKLERERFLSHWRSPPAGVEILSGSEWPVRYAARLNDVLVVAIDGTRPGVLPAPEREIMARLLERHAGAAALTVVLSHLPMWPLASGREREIIADPDLLGLLHAHGVDVYASGHHHVFYPGVDEAGMVHLAVGALGGNSRRFANGELRQPHSLALVHYDNNALRITALQAPQFSAEVQAGSLPPAIDGPLGTLRRLDGPAVLRR